MKSLTTDQADQDRYREAWERLFDLTHDLLGIVGFDGRLKQVNPAWSRTLGWTDKELLDNPWTKPVHPEDRPAALAAGEELLAGNQVISLENRYQCLDGSYRRITWDSFPNMEKRLIMIVGRDITESRRAEEALLEEHSFRAGVIQGVAEGLCVCHEINEYPYVRFSVWNNRMTEITGYTREEINSLGWYQTIYSNPEVQARARERMQNMRVGDDLHSEEWEITRADGKKRVLTISTSILLSCDGIVHVLALMHDITESRRAEDKLREQLTFQQVLMDTIPNPIFYKNVEGIYLGCNKALGDFLGLTKEEIIGKSVYDIYPKDLADKYFEMDAALFRQPGVQIYDFSTMHANGSRKDVTYYKATYSAIDGAVAGLVGVMVDITHRKRAEEALRESEQRLANIIDFLPDATLVIDNEGQVIAWNKAMEEMTGVKAEDMVGMGNYEYALPFYGERRPMLIDLVHKPQEKLEKYTEVKREGLTLSGITPLPGFRGREAYLFGKASLLLDSHGNYAGAIESIRDITDLQKAEAERLRLDKLESLGLLAGGIAHDFNNILTAIIGNISLAMLDKKMERQVDERLMAAEKACLQAQTLARQLLTFAKGGAPVKKITSVATTLDESVMFACRGFKTRCELRIPDDLWWVEADPGQLGQVFQNLIINAVQAMPAGGKIDIGAENFSLKESRDVPLSPGKYVKISIRDQGIGIPAEYLPKIFDPYFTTKQAGSGLGLATAFSIIKNHRGHISAESTMGVGTTFHIYLPASDQKTVSQPGPDRKALLGKGKILVMDDEEIVRDVLGKMLANLGYEAKFAQDGAEAVEKFAAAQKTGDKFEAVILDLTVPGGVGGKDTIRKLLDIDPQVKAIVSSGYSDDPIMANFEAYGFSGVIAKPYKVLDLSAVLHDIINH